MSATLKQKHLTWVKKWGLEVGRDWQQPTVGLRVGRNVLAHCPGLAQGQIEPICERSRQFSGEFVAKNIALDSVLSVKRLLQNWKNTNI